MLYKITSKFVRPLAAIMSSFSNIKGGVTLDAVPNFEDYAAKNKDSLKLHPIKELQDKHQIETYPVNKDFNKIVTVWKGDITKLVVDAIVNAANNSLLGGGGVDGAIHKAAGKELYNECKGLGGCETGDAKITQGYCLPSKHVIHTVGPRISGGNLKPEILKSCYLKSLELATDNELRTIAFPCISTGIYGYPSEDAAVVVLQAIRKYLEHNKDKFDRIIFCVFLEEDVKIYETLLQIYFPTE